MFLVRVHVFLGYGRHDCTLLGKFFYSICFQTDFRRRVEDELNEK